MARAKAVSVAAIALGLTSCAHSVVIEPAPHATDVACSDIIVGFHGSDELAGLARREVTAQSAAAWGEPGGTGPAVTLRCGVDVPGPSTEGCLGVNDVDWIGPRDPLNNDRRYTTYGRSPAIEVFVPAGSSAAIETVLTEIGDVVRSIPATRSCL